MSKENHLKKSAARFAGSFAKVSELPNEKPEVCFLGRSNSGKSSLLRALLSNPRVVKISGKPGHTRTANLFLTDRAQLVDLPGYGYAKVSHSIRDDMSRLLGDYLQGRPTLRAGFLTHDCRRELTREELQLASLFREARIPLILVMTKADKLNQKEKAAKRKQIQSYEDSFHSVQLVSAHEGTGLDYILRFIQSL